MKVLIVGDYPPPYGGSSVQVSVLRRLLSATPGFTCRVLDIGKSRRQRRAECLLVRNPAEFGWRLLSHAARQYTIHLHQNGHNLKSWVVILACGMAGIFSRRKTVVSIGSGLAPDFIQESSLPTRLLVRVALRLTGAVICRNEQTRAAIVRLGIPAEKIAIVPGFYGVRTDRLPAIPGEIEEFLRGHSPVVAAISSLGPEYGIPLFVEAVHRLRPYYPRLGVLLIGPERFEGQGLDGDFLAVGELPHEVVLAVMRKVDVFVRPTYFDGDASSVREALALGVRVVASDTDFRPDGAVLFRRGNVTDLAEKIALALQNGDAVTARLGPAESGAFELLLAIYRRLGERNGISRGGLA